MDMPFARDDQTNYCQNCKSYSSIDSGYGFCLKNPPVPVVRKRRVFWFFTVEHIAWEYPMVAWCQMGCSHQVPRTNKCLTKAFNGLVNVGGQE